MKVAIILDPQFGERTSTVHADAFWLADSPSNRALATRLWAEGRHDPNSAVFDVARHGSAVESAARVFRDVLDHHPQWDKIDFIGVSLGAPLAEALEDEGVVAVRTSDKSFVVSRPSDGSTRRPSLTPNP